jgi:fucose permease
MSRDEIAPETIVPSSWLARRSSLLLVIAYIGFISLGLPDAITGVAWPELRDDFQQPPEALGFVSVALGCGYFISSFFAGKLAQRLGIGLLLAASTFLVALAMLQISAASWFWLILACITLWGLGSGAIDSGLNHYAASHFSARHMNWLHACYSLGATMGPFVMTGAIFFGGSWRLGYAIVGGLVLLLAVTFTMTLKLWDDGSSTTSTHRTPPVSMIATLGRPLVWLQIVIFAFYTGVEFLVGQWTTTVLAEARAYPKETAGIIAGVYYGSIGVGRVFLGGISDWFGVDRLLRGATVFAVLGTVLFAFAPVPWLGVVGLILLGLGLAPIFPCLMSRTPERLGTNYAAHAIGFQVSAATIGGAAIPALAGIVVKQFGLESIPIMSVVLAAVIWLLHEILLCCGRKPAE